MTSVIEIDINVPQARLAELFADPANTPEWMDDLARYEPISGEPGMPGSTYRLVPKKGDMVFVATVISRTLPDEVRLNLDSSTVDVSVTGRLVALSPETTRLVSEEVFTFKGAHKLFAFAAEGPIKTAHRRHMDAFKRFAEQHG